MIGVIGVALALINYSEVDFFGPRLDEYTMSNGDDNRWGLVLSRGKPRIGYYDQSGETGTEPDDWLVYGNLASLVVRRNNERVFPIHGGLRLFFRQANQEWEEVFIQDEDLEEWLDPSGHFHNSREFFKRYANSQPESSL